MQRSMRLSKYLRPHSSDTIPTSLLPSHSPPTYLLLPHPSAQNVQQSSSALFSLITLPRPSQCSITYRKSRRFNPGNCYTSQSLYFLSRIPSLLLPLCKNSSPPLSHSCTSLYYSFHTLFNTQSYINKEL